MIDLQREGEVFVLTMDDGENRWNTTFVRAFAKALDEAEASEGPAALVTTSSSEKFFSNGLDLEWVSSRGEHRGGDRGAFGGEFMALMARIITFPMPTVAAVNGHAFGAGFMAALCHDVHVFSEHLLDGSDGPGACGKCHAAGLSPSSDPKVAVPAQWALRGGQDRPHTTYTHAPHISILGPDASCVNCHKLNTDADYAAYFKNTERTPGEFVSNFSAIGQETCAECHREGVVRFDCQLCHTYHRSPKFKVGFIEKRVATQ